jgi:allantoicase
VVGSWPEGTHDRMTEPQTFLSLPDLASRRLGGSVMSANDETFADKENLIKPEAPTFRAGTFGPKGQVYDGWETRRRRSSGHDWVVLRLGVPGVVRGVVVDTAFFTGNYPPLVSVEACGLEGYPSASELESASWTPLLERSPVKGDTANAFPVSSETRFTHVRLSIYPDGGVARFRVHGDPIPDPRFLDLASFDLAAMETGAYVTHCSNMFYSSPTNLISPGLASSMGDGWETSRRRDDGNDWVAIRLAGPGLVRLAELDTSHFVGNAPGFASLRARDARLSDDVEGSGWFDLMPRTPLLPDTRHRFLVSSEREATHVLLNVFPDGGMARLRLHGALTSEGQEAFQLRWFNSLPAAQAEAVATADWGLTVEEVRKFVGARPLTVSELPAPAGALFGPF